MTWPQALFGGVLAICLSVIVVTFIERAFGHKPDPPAAPEEDDDDVLRKI